jgi:hypothetical protein
MTMATSRTSSFYLTESVEIATGTVSGLATMDVGSLISVGDRQGLAIEAVELIWQNENTVSGVISANIQAAVIGNTTFECQLTDLNPNGVILRADDNSIIASGALNLDDVNNITSMVPDIVPDVFGTLDEARHVISDVLHIVAHSSTAVDAGHSVWATVRIKARIVTLGVKDFMGLAITASQSDQ